MKACNKFVDDLMKVCLKHKTTMKVDHEIKDIKLCFY